MTYRPEYNPGQDPESMVMAEANQQIAWVLTEWLELYREVHQEDVDDHPTSTGQRD